MTLKLKLEMQTSPLYFTLLECAQAKYWTLNLLVAYPGID